MYVTNGYFKNYTNENIHDTINCLRNTLLAIFKLRYSSLILSKSH